MKKPVVLLIVLGVLVAFAVIYEKGYINKIAQGGGLVGVPRRELVLADLDTTKIRKIRVTEGDKHLNLALADGRWAVLERNRYPASYDKVESSVRLLAEMKVKNKTEVQPALLGDVKLLAPGEASAERTGLKVELLDEKDAVLATLIAGSTTTTSGGSSANSGNMFGGPGELRMVRVVSGSDKDTVWQVDDSLGELTADAQDWVDKAFVDVRNVKSAEITAPVAANSWKAERKDMNSPFTLVNPAPGEEFDTAKADGLSSVLSGATFQDVLPKDKAAEVLMKDPFKVKLVTEEGFTYDISAVEKKDGTAAAGSDANTKIYATVKVSADIPEKRTAPKDEKPEDKEKNDKEFETKNKPLKEKLAKEKAFENWVFEVPSYNSGILVKKRSEVLRDKTAPPSKKEEPTASVSIPGVVPDLTGAPKLPPPVQPPTPPQEPVSTPPATTPTPVPGAKSTEAPAPPATNPPAVEPKPSEAKPAAPEAKPAMPEPKPAAPEAKPAAPEAKPAPAPAPAPEAPKSEPAAPKPATEAPKPAAEPKPAADPETPPAPKPGDEAKPPGQ